MYKLIAVAGKLRGQEFILEPGENIVGRDSENNVVLPVEGVSKKHFSITLTGDVAYLKDLGSSNGTFINGRLVKNGTIQDGDKIALPDIILQVVHVFEKKITIYKKATKSENEVELPAYMKPPPMPKPLPQKVIYLFKYRFMPVIHGMNEEYEWRIMVAIALALFIITTISLTIFPILGDSKKLLLLETAKRGVHFAQEIGRLNYRALEKKNLDRVDTNFLDNEDGVSSYELFDMDGRIVRPIGKLNEYISDTFSIKALEWSKSKMGKGNELVQILDEGVIGVASRINAYNPKLGAMDAVGVISIRFAPRSLAIEATKNSRAYLEALSTSGLVALVFFGVIYYLTLRPLEELKYLVEEGVKGKIRTIESKYLMGELKNLKNTLNTLFQRVRELSNEGGGDFAEVEGDETYIAHMREFLKGVGQGMVLNSNKDMMQITESAEDLLGIRQSVSEGVPILECAREKGFAATIIELCDKCAENQGFCQQGDYELGGHPHQLFVTALMGQDSMAKSFLVTFQKLI